ncbi:sulfate ABC transporter permease [Candidatus Acidianus copahuensis]|uniref:Sulfate ABC transporter permease n=2 Tax=Acidianus TaxID=12914 RepID=A0A031LMR6_9CREN|nr:ABC transporter permease [Candidatus Acidianus copahuensis]EZQ06928.1 sulfate ABC transporter permease [Candidatus Acidianus copahuensis]NON62737.1 ABC transporter permease [Acidianus sp. RZ1]
MKWFKIIGIFLAIVLVVPVFLLIYMGFFVFRSPQAFSTQFMSAVELSLVSSATAAIVDFALFTPLAYYISRFNDFFTDSLVDIPASIPHPVVGIALVFLDSPYTPIGKFLLSLGINFFDSYTGLVAALVIVSAPIFIRSMKNFFDSMPRIYEEYARSLGGGTGRIFLRVVLRNSFRGIISSSLISMSRAMSEFGSIAIIAYYVLSGPFAGVSPASILIYEWYGYYGTDVAVTASAIMIVIGIIVLTTIRILQYKTKNI